MNIEVRHILRFFQLWRQLLQQRGKLLIPVEHFWFSRRGQHVQKSEEEEHDDNNDGYGEWTHFLQVCSAIAEVTIM